MYAKIELSQAFSVRDEHEFLPVQHLLARLNPRLLVKEVATGVQVNANGTVHWGWSTWTPNHPADSRWSWLYGRQASILFTTS